MNKTRILSLCLSVLMLLTASVPALAYEAGTYSAEAAGNNGPVKVEVEMDGQSILAVRVVEHAETPGICDLPIEQIPQAIVAGQTLAVDVVSGATNTSVAILKAAEECIKQAGGDVEALKAAAIVEEEEKQIEVTTDVLVVGAGIAGLSAAIAAREAGAEVVLLEKQGIVGGSMGISGGGFAAVESYLEKETGVEDSVENAVERWKNWGTLWGVQHPEGRDGWPVEERITFIAENTAENIDWMRAHGIEFVRISPATNNLTRLFPGYKGAGVAQTLLDSATNAGVAVYMQTPATDLIMKDGAVAGVVAKNGNTTYQIYGNVIMATGGYSANAEMVAEYTPEYAGTISVSASGNTGDGLKMALEAGAVLYDDPWVISYMPQMADSMMANEKASGLSGSYTSHLMVNKDGSRFINESSWYAALSNAIVMLSGGSAYSIFDSSDADTVAMLEAGLETGEVFKGDTLEALAAEFGADAATFAENVKKYNTIVETGIETDFPLASTAANGSATQNDSPYTAVKQGPYYALRFHAAHMGTMGGVVTNDNACVLNAEGTPIEGLWAAGEMSNRPFYDHTYLGSVSLASYSIMGRVAGESAAADALNK